MPDQKPTEVFVFGAEAVRDHLSIKRLAIALEEQKNQGSVLVIVPALADALDQLGEVAKSHSVNDGQAPAIVEQVRANHFHLVDNLFLEKEEIYASVNDVFVEVEWIVEEDPHPDQEYTSDQLAGAGCLASSRIISAYLQSQGMPVEWLDVRDLIVTDNTYGKAGVLEEETAGRARPVAAEILESGRIVITQGGIGATTENFTTTLGPDGLARTAMLLAPHFKAESITVWEESDAITRCFPPGLSIPVRRISLPKVALT